MLKVNMACTINNAMIYYFWGNQSEAAYLPSEGINNPPIQKKGGLPMVTYADLIQIGIFIVALIGLCYQIFKGRK